MVWELDASNSIEWILGVLAIFTVDSEGLQAPCLAVLPHLVSIQMTNNEQCDIEYLNTIPVNIVNQLPSNAR